MLNYSEHLKSLVRHIDLVRNSCLILGEKLISQGEKDFGRNLIARGFVHDASKFSGIEWMFLHAGSDVPKDKLELAMIQHQSSNDHHPEFHGGFDSMPPLCVAELACDWLARSQEFGTSIKGWIADTAMQKYKIDAEGENYKLLVKYVGLLTENIFVK